ncbi:MAG: isopentenyl-diphosphate Delta-isomerase [Thermoanaerobacteraceae bacterium]|nr:isopentenyl-diphosphate Delta-isomerase [Thermoanaerobacteraceae bacterium]MDN5312998.1 isopentenyl-diphosphate Delta-isomerase [Thermoanaerobacteraceae bacterium]
MQYYIRKKRKKEHIKYSLLLEKDLGRNNFDDITLVHNCLTQVDIDEIDVSTDLNGIKLNNPIIINAMTGGFYRAKIINGELAKIARHLGLAMAVGSQKIALDDPSSVSSFQIVREINPEGIIFANIGSDASVDDAIRAVEMIKADALQIHLNAPQEIVMREGRKNFKGTLDNIEEIIQNVKVPVILKEVGFGIAMEEAEILVEKGVKIIDIGGAGGTNFIAIENKRRSTNALSSLQSWGIPTPASLIEVVYRVGNRADIICSGGLRNGLDVAKSLALGAKAAAFAGLFLYILLKKGPLALKKYIIRTIRELMFTMAMSGVKNLSELRKRPVIIEGKTYNWVKNRGISI